jgi:L-alanine-DL-glutamate epimerase-like enolase superfamily enzyme
MPHKRGMDLAKIERVEILMVDLVPATKRTDAIQSFVSQETPMVRLYDSDGAIGTGYSYTIGTGGHSVMELLKRTLAPALIGRDADRIEAIWRDLLYMTHATSVGAITSLALAAIDTALWDLRSRKTGIALHKLAGGAQESVPVYTTDGGWLHLPIEHIVADTLAVKEQGFKGAKVKIGRPIAEDVARLSALRDAVGDDFEIFTDANQSFRLDDAIRRAAAYAPLGLGWIEEPLVADDVHNHTLLSQHSDIPVAVGESLYSLRQFNAYCRADACSIVQVDVARIGGITPWLKVAHMAEAYNIAVCPHFLMELHTPLCAAVPNAKWVEYIPQLEPITSSGLRILNGRAIPSDDAGLGIDWDWDAIAHLTVEGSHWASA